VVGMPEIFNLTQEYQFPASAAEKVKFCGYIRRDYGCKVPELIHQELEIKANEKLVLVTPGGGGDGYRLVETYLQGLGENTHTAKIKSLIICGPEMPPAKREKIAQISQQLDGVQVSEFTDDMASYLNATDAVVSMGGYNTICEILSLSKRAVVVPRIKPVEEQWIRAQRMADFGLFTAIHPEKLTPQHLMRAVLEQLDSPQNCLPPVDRLDLNALPRISNYLSSLLYGCLSQRQWNLSEMVYLHEFEAVS